MKIKPTERLHGIAFTGMVAAAVLLAVMLPVGVCVGGSATWSTNPSDSLWTTATNWMPATVPNSETDVATFGSSTITNVTVGNSTTLDGAVIVVSEIVFAPGAGGYTLTSTPSNQTLYADHLGFYGAGIVNNSGRIQNLVTATNPAPAINDPGSIFFDNSASAGGTDVIITNEGSFYNVLNGAYGGATVFGSVTDTPSAGDATFINEGGKVSGTLAGGTTTLYAYSTADAATFINEPGEVDGAAAGHTFLYTGGNIGRSTFINNAATVTGAEGGWTELDIGICAGSSFTAEGAASAGPQGGQIYTFGGAGNATFTAKGGEGAGSQGGLLQIHNMPDSEETVAIAEGGGNGGSGGMIVIEGYPTSLDQVQFQLQGNATMEMTQLVGTRTVSIGSLSGTGTVSLSHYTLNIGNNNLSTVFAGIFRDGGAIAKVGAGTLTLSGANQYHGGSMVIAGTLIVNNPIGSATGSGNVAVNGGTLGGGGTVAGAVTVGTGSSSGAVLQPGFGSTQKITLTIQSPLTLNSDATYSFALKSPKAEVIANGVTIISGAQFTMTAPKKKLRSGIKVTVISNTSGAPISGNFANLPDGGTITSGANTFQANYEGGDGNDLTLTVQ